MGIPEHLLETRREQLKRQSVTNGSLPDNLQRLGVAPEEITDVVVSHMHPDHLGWVSMDDRPFFANATVWVHEADVAHFMGPTALDETGFRVMLGTPPTKQRMAPVHDRMEVWTHDQTVAPGITVRHLPGHTPGNAMVVVASGTERAYVLGDTFHCPLELVDLNFHIPGDLDPALAQIGKDQLLREIEDGSIAVASSHFPDLAFGRVFLHDGERTFRWDD